MTCIAKTVLGALALGVTPNVLASQAASVGPAAVTAIVDVNLIPMDRNRVLRHQTVIVRDGKISAISPARTATIPVGARVISGADRYLIPGLADMHVHFRPGARSLDPDDPISVLADSTNQRMLRMFLANGVTSVLSMGSDAGSNQFVLDLRARTDRGEIVGPRILASQWLGYRTETAASAEQIVRAAKAAGYDFVKTYSFLQADAYRAATSTARAVGLRVVGHLPRALGLDSAVAFGQVMVAHAEEFLYNPPFLLTYADTAEVRLDAQRIPAVVALLRRFGTYVTPTMAAYSWVLTNTSDSTAASRASGADGLPRQLQEEWSPARNAFWAKRAFTEPRRLERLRIGLAFQTDLTRAMHQAGVPLLAGTDTPLAGVVPGASLHAELERLVDAGLSPFEALLAATRTAGEFVDRSFGVVRVGATGDLVLLRDNPLSSIRNTRGVIGVMRGGRWYSPDELLRTR